MEIKEIYNKDVWESFLMDCKEKTFLDSWNWGEFQKKEGNKIWRMGIYNSEQGTSDNEQLIGTALVIKIKARRGTFLFIPHGPNTIFNDQFSISKNKVLEILINKLKDIAKEEKASFIRVAPIWERNEKNNKVFKGLNFKDAPIHMHPELTWELDISFSEEELLKNMRKTTRYLIRQAEKNSDIKIIKSADISDLEKFNQIYQKTVQRHHFAPFSFNYLKNQFSSFIEDRQIVIFLGKYKDEIISSAIVVFWQNIGFYHHGASLSKYNSNKTPVSYLLQWEAIKEAKKRGCRLYNFWGVAPVQNLSHPWYGLSLFKMGFGGYKKEYIKTQDLILSPKYYFNYIIEKMRKIKRGL